MKIAVQLDPIAALKPAGDTSLMLMEEAQRRGHEVYTYHPHELSWYEGNLIAPLTPVTLDMKATPFYKLGAAKSTMLSEMNVILMRQDPPFDMAYITATHLLQQLPPTTRVLNDPAGVRNAPEKLSILGFAEYMPPTLISRDPEAIDRFAQAHHTIIAKPLYGYGGRGVFKLTHGDVNRDTLLEFWTESSREPLMWQAFLPEVADGDRRVLFIDGKPACVFGRTPAEDSIRANMRVGGTPVQATLTPRQQLISNALTPFLKSQGLMLAGVDFIGDYLTEINVTSPTGMRAAEKLYGINLAATFWDTVERH